MASFRGVGRVSMNFVTTHAYAAARRRHATHHLTLVDLLVGPLPIFHAAIRCVAAANPPLNVWRTIA